MFHAALFYFRKFHVGAVQDSESTMNDTNLLKRELMMALETARGRLAIAIAEESKSTPWNLRRYYLETCDCVRQIILRLHSGKDHEEYQPKDWALALETLSRISLKDSADPLCKSLRSIVAALE